MTLENPYALPFFGIGLLVLGVFGFGIHARRRTNVFWEYSAMVGSTALHTIAYALDLASVSLEQKLFFHRIAWLGFAVTPSAVALLALRFASDRPRPRLAVALGVVSLAFAALSWTNGHHHLLEGPATLVEQGGVSFRAQDRGPLFWLYFVFASGCALTSLGIYGASWLSGPAVRRKHAFALFLAMLAPWVLNVVFFSGPSIVRPTPFALGISALVITWAFFRDGLLELIPVAHERVVATLEDPIFVFDREGRLVDRNPAAHALLERAGGDEARHPSALFACDAGADEPIALGARRYVRRSLPVGGGGHVVSLHDVTEREAHAEATARALEARSEFIARMSHELRTPLQGVLGSLELLERAGVSEAQSRHVETAKSSARVLLGLVDEVLDFERASDGIVIEEGEFVPAEVAREAASAVSAAAKLAGLSLVIEVDEASSGALSGDARRIGQVLLNLAGNAVKFTPSGEVKIRARTELAGGRGDVVFEVEDTGPGVPEESLPRMFEPFTQLDEARSRGRDGVGLGLAISRRLADAMGAALELENRPGGGLVARLSLRSVPVLSPSRRSSNPPLRLERVPARVLLVEDHPVSRAVVLEMLQKIGARAEVASGGAEALARAAEARFDLAFVDLHMPGMDGLETTRRLLALERPPKVVIFTADERPGVNEECLGAGAAEVLKKPADSRALAAALRRHARPAEARRGGPGRTRLLDAFARTYPLEIDALRRALGEGDAARRDEILHGMIGASALLGLTEVASLCRDASADPTPERIARLEAACLAASG